jgi:hypothetical protein
MCRRKLLKQRNPRALQVLLGRNTNVVTLQRSEGIRMKEEYHSFRDRTGCAPCPALQGVWSLLDGML